MAIEATLACFDPETYSPPGGDGCAERLTTTHEALFAPFSSALPRVNRCDEFVFEWAWRVHSAHSLVIVIAPRKMSLWQVSLNIKLVYRTVVLARVLLYDNIVSTVGRCVATCPKTTQTRRLSSWNLVIQNGSTTVALVLVLLSRENGYSLRLWSL